jgi:hypothetical protein
MRTKMPTDIDDQDAKWHWAEGMKFALEGIKLLFALNGASAVAILTFIGNVKSNSNWLIWAMVFFACGTASAVVSMMIAYVTELQYGNSSWKWARVCHDYSYCFVGLGLLFFVVGMIFAAIGLSHCQYTLSPPAQVIHAAP